MAYKVQYALYTIILRNLNYAQCITPMEKAWFMASMEYSPNWKDIMTPIDYTPMVNSPYEKDMVSWKIVFLSGNHRGKTLKIEYKRDSVSQN